MITASDLVDMADDQIAKIQAEEEGPKQRVSNKRISLPSKGLALYAVLVVSVIIWAFANKPITGRNLRIWDFLTGNRLAVNGIVCNERGRSALVRGKVVYEGDMVGKYKVVKISKDGVEFEKDGKIIVRRPNR